MALCACGCGEETKGGTFRPGHDQALRSSIERDIGGLLRLAELVKATKAYVADEIPLEEFGQRVRRIVGS